MLSRHSTWQWIQDHRSRLWRWSAWIVLLCILAWSALRLLRGPEVVASRVQKTDFVQSVVASGRVEAPHRIDVGVQLIGVVSRIPVTEGQHVLAGAPLMVLESTELQAALGQSLRQKEQAGARLRQLREVQAPVALEALLQAQASYETAAQNLRRSRQLQEKGFIGDAALDEALRAERVARSQMRSAEQQLHSASPQGSDVAIAKAAYAQAEAAVAQARSRLGYALVSAPVSGTLIARNVEPGDVVQPGKALMVLSPDGEAQLVVQIDEKNIGSIQPGQQALASADASPEQKFEAQVFYINPGVDADRGSVEVKLRVPAPPSFLKQDMTVSVDIAVARRAQASLVPAAALHDVELGQPWVYRIEAGRLQRRLVKLGLHGKGWYEVLDGLQPGDEVVTDASTELSSGQRVRPVISLLTQAS